ncbi:MAG: hypothetical protein HQ495_03655 [Alphaproteobacteria bacterium]|mgnify:CR=1 FL=1|nr:hypothetical protein [Alphaproteobacteria bacterium]
MRSRTIVLGLAALLAGCSEEYEQACRQAVMDNRADYAVDSAKFDYELSRTHYFSDGTAQSVSVYYLKLTGRADDPRIRITCYANTDSAFVYAVVRDDVLGDRVVGAAGETLPRRPSVN